MKLVFYSVVLNHHQAGVADELYGILGDGYRFVELTACNDTKGGVGDFGGRPYLIRSWRSAAEYAEAMELAKSAEVCVFSGFEALPFEKERMRLGLLSFDMGERLLKRGWINLLSPRISKMIFAYFWHGWRKKPLYKLCNSGFTASDCRKLGMFLGKCYKWGYFTPVSRDFELDVPEDDDKNVSIMWCARFLTLKHPEFVIEMAKILKDKAYDFVIDIYGDDAGVGAHERAFSRQRLEALIDACGVGDRVRLHGRLPNSDIIAAMRRHQIFLFTSDRREGWGAVANESMANGCVLVASDAIGSTPYLIREGYNGMVFRSGDSASLAAKIEWLFNHPLERKQMRLNALTTMRTLWNPNNAAVSLLTLIDNIRRVQTPGIEEGPCSEA